MASERPRVLPPRPEGVRCVSNPYAAHGEGHNRVCVCLCRCCVAEREPAQLTLFDARQLLPIDGMQGVG